MSKDTGGPAFPVKANHEGVGQYDSNGVTLQHTGLSLRDYFAAKALSTLVESWADSSPKHAAECAKVAYQFADAMLVERDKP